jgi:carboxypeptidase C (cathepsin A)
LGGGPGLSSQLSNLREIGPFVLTDDLWVAIKNNTYAWTKVASLLFIDQPLGTGFSCLISERDIPSSMTGIYGCSVDVVKDFYQAFNQLFS